MAKFTFVAFVVFLASVAWLIISWRAGNKTKSWDATTAEVLKNDAQTTRHGRQPRGWLTTISYSVDGTEYVAKVDEYLLGKSVTVYVNPHNPSEVVGKAGARIQDMFMPIIATAGSGLFLVVLGLMIFSPKDD